MQIKEYDSEGKQTGNMLPVCDLIKTRKLFRDKQMEMREHRKRLGSNIQEWQTGETKTIDIGSWMVSDLIFPEDLRGIKLSEDLRGLKIYKADCRHAYFQNAKLQSVVFRYVMGGGWWEY